MPDLRVPRFIPRDPCQVVFGLEIFEANVPNESAKRLDGIDLVALRANEAKAQVLVGILGKAFLLICRVVVASVLEGVKPRIPQRYRAARERLGIGSQWLGPFSARIRTSYSADRGE